MKMLIVAAVVALSGCAATQEFSSKMPGTFIHTCMQDAGATLEGCKQKEWAEFNTMVDTFVEGGGCDSTCRFQNRHSNVVGFSRY
jgi:uncharacterized protein YceK